jgi:hypothetical protein
MQLKLVIAPLLMCASPALAQPASQVSPPIADPAVADRLANAAQAVSDAVLNMPVGDLKAAAEGRRATPDEKRMTVGDLARRDDPDFDRKLHRQIAEARPMVRQGMKAVNESLPAVMQSLEQARRSLERALANLPDPTYPQR